MSRQLDEPPDLKGLPPAEKAVMARALAKQPDKRYESCRQFADALFEAVHGPAGGGGGGGRKVPLGLVLIGVAVLVVAVMGVYFGVIRDSSSTTRPSTEPVTNNGTGNGDPVKDKKKDPPKNGDKKVQPPSLPVPDGYRAASEDAKQVGNIKYPTRIERIPIDGSPINGPVPTFVLVETSPGKAIYVLDTKVWNGLMAWASGNPWANRPANQVAIEASLAEAVDCAKKLGGRIPTPAEWDAAAGFPPGTPGAGLVKPEAVPVVNSAIPGRVDSPNRDVTTTGVSNMTGNGREWTSGVITTKDGKQISVLRGRSFTLATPLTAKDLAAEQETPQTQFPDAKSKYTSFRVVLDLP